MQTITDRHMKKTHSTQRKIDRGFTHTYIQIEQHTYIFENPKIRSCNSRKSKKFTNLISEKYLDMTKKATLRVVLYCIKFSSRFKP